MNYQKTYYLISSILGPNALPDAPRKHKIVLIYTHDEIILVTTRQVMCTKKVSGVIFDFMTTS